MTHVLRINENIPTHNRERYNIICQKIDKLILRISTGNIKISYNSYCDFYFNIMLDVTSSFGFSLINATINVSGNYEGKTNRKTNTKTHSCDIIVYDKTNVKGIVEYFDDRDTAKSIIHGLRNDDDLKESLECEYGSSDPRCKWFFGEFMDILYNELAKEFSKL